MSGGRWDRGRFWTCVNILKPYVGLKLVAGLFIYRVLAVGVDEVVDLNVINW